MNFGDLDWKILDRLRANFLQERFGGRGYWESRRDLAQYDLTFAQRIGWKWDAVLAELAGLGWQLPDRIQTAIDWGCGSGIAGRRVLADWPTLRNLLVLDSSPLAMEFAIARAREEQPGAQAAPFASPDASGAVLVLSHVWNELDTRQRVQLLQLASSAEVILWVEPGTHEIARDLQTVREHFLPAFRVIAPCTHQGKCGLLAPGMEQHWCHHFARPPAEVFTSSDWSRFAERAGIDLRSLPYAFLALERRDPAIRPETATDWERLLGRPRFSKPYARVLSCGEHGVEEVEIGKRTLPELFRMMKDGDVPHRIHWERTGKKVAGFRLPRSADAGLPPASTDSTP